MTTLDPRCVRLANDALDWGLLAALGDQRSALLVYLLLREAVERAEPTATDRDGPISVGLVAVGAHEVLEMDPRSVRRHVKALACWGWIVRRGHAIHLGERRNGEARFYFDAWLASRVTNAAFTSSKRTLAARVQMMRAALRAPRPNRMGEAGLAVAPGPTKGYVSVEVMDPLLRNEEGRGAVLACACLRRLAFVPSFVAGQHAGARNVRVAQDLLGLLLGVHESTVARWIEVARAHGRVRVAPQGFRKRHVYEIAVPATRADGRNAGQDIARISKAAGSSAATLELLARDRVTHAEASEGVRLDDALLVPRPARPPREAQDGQKQSPSLTIITELQGSVGVPTAFFEKKERRAGFADAQRADADEPGRDVRLAGPGGPATVPLDPDERPESPPLSSGAPAVEDLDAQLAELRRAVAAIEVPRRRG